MDRNPQTWGFNNDKHKKRPSVHHNLSVHTKALSYISTLITNSQGHWCCDRDSMGRGCIQSDAIHVGKSCKYKQTVVSFSFGTLNKMDNCAATA